MSEELKFPVIAHHRIIVNAPARDDDAMRRLFDGFDLVEPVAEVMANPEFSEHGKQKFQESFVSMMNETLARARGLDHYVMTGELPFEKGCER